MSSITLRDEHSTLQLSQATFETGDDDVHLIAEASMKGFVGRNTSVGVSRRIWDAFVGDFKKLETTRTGCAFSKFCHPVSLNSVTSESLPVSLKLPRWDGKSRSPEARGGCSGCLIVMPCRSWCVLR